MAYMRLIILCVIFGTGFQTGLAQCSADFKLEIIDTNCFFGVKGQLIDQSIHSSSNYTRKWIITDYSSGNYYSYTMYSDTSQIEACLSNDHLFSIALVINDGSCSDSITIPVDSLLSFCRVNFTMVIDSLNNTELVCTNLSQKVDSFNWTRAFIHLSQDNSWKLFGDTKDARYQFYCPPSQYEGTDPSYVRLLGYDVSGNLCGSKKTALVYYGVKTAPNCNSNFSILGENIIDQSVVFIANETNDSYSWDVGIDSVVEYTTKEANHSFDLNIKQKIRLEITKGNCTNVSCKYLTLETPFNANFGYVKDCKRVIFSPDTISNNFIYQWNFGDGFSSDQVFPEHTYAQYDNYYVSLTITDTVSNISIIGYAAVDIVPKFNCNAGFYTVSYQDSNNPISIDFIPNSTNFSGLWFFGDGDSSATDSPKHVYNTPGNYYVKRNMYDPCGEVCDTFSTWITVDSLFPVCHAYFEIELDTITSYTINILNKSNPRNIDPIYLWSFGDGDSAYGIRPTHHYDSFGLFDLCLKVYDSAGFCVDEYCMQVGLDSNGNLLKKDGFTIVIIDKSTLSIKDSFAKKKIKVYPNPAYGLLNISIPGNIPRQIDQIEVYNNIGEQMQVFKTINIEENGVVKLNLNGLGAGIYWLIVHGDSETYKARFIVHQ